MSRIAFIGQRDAILGFKALGITVMPATDRQGALEALANAREQDYEIVFITEPVAREIQAELDELTQAPRPVVTILPDHRGSSGIGMARLKSRVEKAIGVDILFKEEGK